MINNELVFLDCTLRDGGYYNNWDFPREVVNAYLKSMQAINVNVVELGLRSLKNKGFKGACAFSTDDYIRTFDIPSGLQVSVMVNAVEFFESDLSLEAALEKMFPESAATSPVSIVRVACHVSEFCKALPASRWLKDRGFKVGFNLMQVADQKQEEVESLALSAADWPLDVLYFADSMGSMNPDQMALVINWLRKHWTGSLGVHTHDNMGLALQNSLRSMIEGVTWIDATVTGMGRGPGNAKTEYLALEIAENRGTKLNLVPLMALIKKTFAPMQYQHGWGTNTYYYLAGRYGIHPTYIQEMLSDTRYSEEDVLAVIDHLRLVGGKKFSVDTLDTARNFYQGVPRGSWDPKSLLEQREVLLIGAGPSVSAHRDAIQSYIRRVKPFVMVLNTQSQIEANLIDARVACHPVRLLADCEVYSSLPQPLITPASMLPDEIKDSLCTSTLLDFGVGIKENTFEVHEHHAILPNPLVVGYALAIALGGKVSNLKLAGFDGYGAGDPRTIEMQTLFDTFKQYSDSVGFCSITPTYYSIPIRSIYAI